MLLNRAFVEENLDNYFFHHIFALFTIRQAENGTLDTFQIQ